MNSMSITVEVEKQHLLFFKSAPGHSWKKHLCFFVILIWLNT